MKISDGKPRLAKQEPSNKNFFGYSTDTKYVAPITEGNIRLLQQYPAWDLHLLLRVNRKEYSVENVPFSVSSGANLPIVIQGNVVYAEGSAQLASSLSAPFDTPHEQQDIAEDFVMTTYVTSLRDLTLWLDGLIGNVNARQPRSVHALGSGIMEWYYRFGEPNSNRVLPSVFAGCSEEWVLQYLHSMYAFLESKINLTANLTLSGSIEPKLADAILFSHVMQARGNPRILLILESFPGIQNATAAFLRTYFFTTSLNISWQDSNLQLCRNEIIRMDGELLKSLQAASLSSSQAHSVLDKVAKCTKSTFLLDYDIQNCIPWRAKEIECDSNGDIPVVFNLRHLMFSTIVASSFAIYGWRALYRSNA